MNVLSFSVIKFSKGYVGWCALVTPNTKVALPLGGMDAASIQRQLLVEHDLVPAYDPKIPAILEIPENSRRK